MLFSGIPHLPTFVANDHMAKWLKITIFVIYGLMAIQLCMKKEVKWGIPERKKKDCSAVLILDPLITPVKSCCLIPYFSNNSPFSPL